MDRSNKSHYISGYTWIYLDHTSRDLHRILKGKYFQCSSNKVVFTTLEILSDSNYTSLMLHAAVLTMTEQGH